MAYSPATFYTLAQTLRRQSNGDGAQLRACISRAYYSAFLTARDHAGLSSFGEGGHWDVIKRYRKHEILKLRPIGDSLADLKELREIADYEPDTDCSLQDGDAALLLAIKVLKLLNVRPPSMLTSTPQIPAEPSGH